VLRTRSQEVHFGRLSARNTAGTYRNQLKTKSRRLPPVPPKKKRHFGRLGGKFLAPFSTLTIWREKKGTFKKFLGTFLGTFTTPKIEGQKCNDFIGEWIQRGDT
jgi:hypothetical protein